MVGCNQIEYEQGVNWKALLEHSKLEDMLCPILKPGLLTIEGQYSDETFDYIEIVVAGCDLGDECASLEDVMSQSINFYSLKGSLDLRATNVSDLL